jgi:hypothetical protein
MTGPARDGVRLRHPPVRHERRADTSEEPASVYTLPADKALVAKATMFDRIGIKINLIGKVNI